VIRPQHKKGACSRPRLRPVETFPVEDADGSTVGLRDASGLSEVMLSLSPSALYLLSLMDGTRSTEELCRQFQMDTGHAVSLETVNTLIDHLDTARFLEGEQFEAHYASLLSAYRARGVRDMPHAFDLGVTDGSGAVFDGILGDAAAHDPIGFVRGVVAPHLDYPRGRP